MQFSIFDYTAVVYPRDCIHGQSGVRYPRCRYRGVYGRNNIVPNVCSRLGGVCPGCVYPRCVEIGSCIAGLWSQLQFCVVFELLSTPGVYSPVFKISFMWQSFGIWIYIRIDFTKRVGKCPFRGGFTHRIGNKIVDDPLMTMSDCTISVSSSKFTNIQ